MKNPTDAGFEQDYNAQGVVDQQSLLIVGHARSNHPTNTQEAEPTLAAIPLELGPGQEGGLTACIQPGRARAAPPTTRRQCGPAPVLCLGRACPSAEHAHVNHFPVLSDRLLAL